jgi:hypothetical protein
VIGEQGIGRQSLTAEHPLATCREQQQEEATELTDALLHVLTFIE